VVRKAVTIIVILLFASCTAIAQDSPANTKTKFYDFDDMLINGKVKKPQVLYIDKRQKVKFERLLRMRKDMMPRLMGTGKDHSLR